MTSHCTNREKLSLRNFVFAVASGFSSGLHAVDVDVFLQRFGCWMRPPSVVVKKRVEVMVKSAKSILVSGY